MLQQPRHRPPDPQFALLVQVVPLGAVPAKQVFGQFKGVPSTQSVFAALHSSVPLHTNPSSQNCNGSSLLLQIFKAFGGFPICVQSSEVQNRLSLQSLSVRQTWQRSLASSQKLADPVQVPPSQSAVAAQARPGEAPPTHFLQTGDVPTTQSSFSLQLSAPLQNLPSSHATLLRHWTHEARWSLQPWQVPPDPQPALALQGAPGVGPLRHTPGQIPPDPQFELLVQVMPGVGPMKHVLGQLGGVPGPHNPVDWLQLSKPLQNEPS